VVVWSEGDGGMELVVPGGVVWSLGGVVDGVDVSLGGELAEPPGDVDC